MALLSEQVKTAIDKASTACVATVDDNEIANVIFVSFLKYIDDETIVIADNKFAKTRTNLDRNPNLSFVVLDTDTKKSYQIKGSVECLTEGDIYQSVVNWVQSKKSDITPKAAFYMSVKEVYCGAEKISG